MKKAKSGAKNSALFLYKKSVATNDSRYECRGHAFIFYHSVKNDMGGDKKIRSHE